MDKFYIEILVDLVPQITDTGFDDIGLGVEVVIPDMFHDHCFGYHSAGVAHQIFEQGKLQRLQENFLICSIDLAFIQV